VAVKSETKTGMTYQRGSKFIQAGQKKEGSADHAHANPMERGNDRGKSDITRKNGGGMSAYLKVTRKKPEIARKARDGNVIPS